MRILMCLTILLCAGNVGRAEIANQMRGNATIMGQISNIDGQPMLAKVLVYSRTLRDGRVSLAAMCSSETDVNGRYQCSHLPVGKYVIYAEEKHNVPETQNSVNSTYRHAFYPNENNPACAEPVSLTSNSNEERNISIGSDGMGSVSGVLSQKSTSPSFRVLIASSIGDLPIDSQVEYDPSQGEFKVPGMTPGTYRIIADWAQDGQVHHQEGVIDVSSERNVSALLEEIGLHPLSGSIFVSASNAPDEKLPKTLILEGVGMNSHWKISTSVKPDNTFSFPPVRDGAYVLHTPTGTPWEVVSVASQKRSTSGEYIELSGGYSALLKVEVKKIEDSIVGQLDSNGSSLEHAGILLQHASSGRLVLAKPDMTGHFAITGLPSGEYRLFAWSEMDKFEYRNPEVLKSLTTKSEVIAVEPDTHITNIKPQIIN